MPFTNSRENMLSHEEESYIESRPKWVVGKIPDLSDYRKISVDSFEEALTLARIGMEATASFIPDYHGKKLMLTFTQSLLVGAAILSREQAEKVGLDFEKYRSVLMVTPTRFGKQLAYDTPILTLDGWKKHGELVPEEDYVFHPSGKPIKVLTTHSWEPDNYIITFSNGEEIEAHANHEWIIIDKSTNESRLVETKQLADFDLKYGGEHKYAIETGEACEFPEAKQAIDAYVMGYTLGKWSDLKIFENYQHASLEQRKLFLAGVIDAIGIVSMTEIIIPILTVSPSFSNGIVNMLRMTGFQPEIDDDFNIRFVPTMVLPTEKKKITHFTQKKQLDIVDVRRSELHSKGNCIQVDSPDGLYLVGKSMITTHNSFLNGIIAIIKAGVEGKEVRIGGATRDKAGIIQEKVVSLLPYAVRPIQDGLIVTDNEGDINKKVQRMATQVSKEALVWKNGGSIKLFSTNETKKNTDVAAAGAIGVGGDFCLLDEIQLMTPVGFRTASRFMMENSDTKRFCVGNPQINGHFRDLYDDPDTFVVHINDIGSIVEGRMTRKGIELTGIPTYSREYRAFCEVEFPDEKSGTRFFSTMPLPLNALKFSNPVRTERFIGVDSAYKGGDSLIVTVLSYNIDAEGHQWFVVEQQIDLKQKYPDWTDETTINVSLDILKICDDTGALNVCLDIGFGIHIYEALRQLDPSAPIEPVNFGEKPTTWRAEADYNAKVAANARAEMHLDLKDLCESGTLYVNGDSYDELTRQMREVGLNSELASAKVKIEAKKDIRTRLGRSPDNLDSLCLAVRAMVLSGVLSGEADPDNIQLAEFY